MTTVVSKLAATPPTRPNQTEIDKRAKGPGSDFNTFLTLLTAQMRNQDPMKPMDSTAFVAQLASFSSVEQQVQMNDKLGKLLGADSARGNLSLGNLIGKQVGHTGATTFSGAPKPLSVSVAPGADSSILVVRDTAGVEVDRQAFPVSNSTIIWRGNSANPDNTPPGSYLFEVESSRKGQVLQTTPAKAFDVVTGVNIGAQPATLVLQGGVTVPISEVTSIAAVP